MPRSNQPERADIHILDAADLPSLKLPERRPLLEPWLHSGDIVMIHAQPGVGKTYFALSIALAVSSGQSLLDWKAPEPSGVLYVDGEMSVQTMQQRLLRLTSAQPDADYTPLRLITPDLQNHPIRSLATPEGRADLEEVITDDISLLILDDLSCLHGGPENDAEAWRGMLELVLRLKRRGVTTILVHYTDTNGDPRGTGGLEHTLDTVINLRRPADYHLEQGARFEIHFQRTRWPYGADVQPIETRLETLPDGSQVWWTCTPEASTRESVYRLAADGLNFREIAAEVGIPRSTVSRHLEQLRVEGCQ